MSPTPAFCTPSYPRSGRRLRVVLTTLIAAGGLLACNSARGDTVTQQTADGSAFTRGVAVDDAISGPPEVVERKERFEGTVESALHSGSYTYFSVRLDSGEQRWAVVLGGKQQPEGSLLRLQSFGIQRNFSSPRLGRSFEELYFCSVDSSTGS